MYYEVGIRHSLRQPLVLLADESERDRLPFDLLQQRTIFYTNDMAGAAACQDSVTEQLRRAIGGHIDSPVQAAVNLRALHQGTDVEKTLADLVTKVDELGSVLARLHSPLASDLVLRTLRWAMAPANLAPTDLDDEEFRRRLLEVSTQLRMPFDLGADADADSDKLYQQAVRAVWRRRLAEASAGAAQTKGTDEDVDERGTGDAAFDEREEG